MYRSNSTASLLLAQVLGSQVTPGFIDDVMSYNLLTISVFKYLLVQYSDPYYMLVSARYWTRPAVRRRGIFGLGLHLGLLRGYWRVRGKWRSSRRLHPSPGSVQEKIWLLQQWWLRHLCERPCTGQTYNFFGNVAFCAQPVMVYSWGFCETLK